jgi:predicted Fe-Mo cluster-binding NifX family protein
MTDEKSAAGDRKCEVRIAIPLAGGLLAEHFGHCEEFVLFGADEESRTLGANSRIPTPPHEPGLLPRWLGDLGVNVVIAGGLGRRARAAFESAGIRVVTGAAAGDPTEIAQAFLDGTLETGRNLCDH